MQASANELQAIIDEAWKNPEFQAASKKLIQLNFKKKKMSRQNNLDIFL